MVVFLSPFSNLIFRVFFFFQFFFLVRFPNDVSNSQVSRCGFSGGHRRFWRLASDGDVISEVPGVELNSGENLSLTPPAATRSPSHATTSCVTCGNTMPVVWL